MATDVTALAKRPPTARRKDPACGTCRKKCRKCDRRRPICDRCRIKGIHCEGYPPRFQFCEITVPAQSGADDASVGQRDLAISPNSPVSLSISRVFGESPPGVGQSSSVDSPSSSTDQSLRDTVFVPLPSSPQLAQSPASTVHLGSASPGSASESLTDQLIIDYFDGTLSEQLTIHVQGTENPFRKHVLPLAYRHKGVMHALLGLSACHMYISGKNEGRRAVTSSLQFRVSALNSLGSLLMKEEVSGLSVDEEEYVLGMALLLVLHDVCETGVSSHGAHLTGVTFLCKRLASPKAFSSRSEATRFCISALAWLDLLRGFSGAEKLAYSPDVRECVRDHASISLHTLVGCPPDMFHRIGQVLAAGKSFLAQDVTLQDFQAVLDNAEEFLRAWDPNQATYPTAHQEWRQLAEAYRHACLLRVLRFPDAFVISCDDPQIKASVSAILDVCAAMPTDTGFYKRLLFPLFLAGADTSSPHQIHYASWRVGQIKHETGFQHPAMTDLLSQVWDERQSNARGWSNVPWMEFTCSELLSSQHAYLFF